MRSLDARLKKLEIYEGPGEGLTITLFGYRRVPGGSLSSLSLRVMRTGRRPWIEHIPIAEALFRDLEQSGKLPRTEEEINAFRAAHSERNQT